MDRPLSPKENKMLKIIFDMNEDDSQEQTAERLIVMMGEYSHRNIHQPLSALEDMGLIEKIGLKYSNARRITITDKGRRRLALFS